MPFGLCNSSAVFQPHPPGPAGLQADHISSQYSHQLQAPSPTWRTCAQSWCASGNISMLLNWRNDQVRMQTLRYIQYPSPHPKTLIYTHGSLTSFMALDKSWDFSEPRFSHLWKEEMGVGGMTYKARDVVQLVECFLACTKSRVQVDDTRLQSST